MSEIELFDIEKILTLGNPEFIIEDAKIQDLNGGIRKKFTSLSKSPVTYTTIYDPTIFRWKFGDEEDPDAYTETADRVIYHTYKKPGTYLVQHQACNFCICSGWSLCFQSIDVVPPPAAPPWLLFAGFFGLLLIRKKECQDYDTKKECEKANCEWLGTQKRCIKKIKMPPREKPKKEEAKRLIRPEEKLKPFPEPKPLSDEDKYLIAKLREKGAVGTPICTGDVCKIGKWTAIAQKGKEPIIIHDP